MSGPAPLTPAERRGRLIVVAIALAILLPQLFLVASVALRGYPPGGSLLARFGLAATISWCLYRGYDWARRWVPIVFVVEALVIIAVLIAKRAWLVAPAVLPVEAVALAAAIVLWTSDSVDAFLRRQAAARRPVLTLGDGTPR